MKLALPLLVAVLGAACATTPPPPAESFAAALETSNTAARLASSADTAVNERLRLARSEIDSASALVRQGKNAEAAHVLARAQADAELGLELARERVAAARVRQASAALEVAREGK